MNRFVELVAKRHRGWPWPGSSGGLTPMFGEDGWCHACGVPRRGQSGSLVLETRGFARGVEGAWIPNWQFNALCVQEDLARTIADQFDLTLRRVHWHGLAPGKALQIVVPAIGDRWFDPDELKAAVIAHHGVAGARCAACEVWRWMPLQLDRLPRLRISPALGDVAVAASPEWFGDGWNAVRQILVDRDLAEMLVAASPRDFVINEVEQE